MTVICYRDGIMAADSLSSHNGRRVASVKKIVRSEDGNLAGSAGDASDCGAFRSWIAAGGPKETIPKLSNEDGDFDAIMVTPDRRMFMLDGSLLPIPFDAPFCAIGSGAPIAIGAMHMGATAEQAVEAAIAHNCYCHGPIQIEHLIRTQESPMPDMTHFGQLYGDADPLSILCAYTEALDRNYDGVLCIASAYSPTGEPFVSIGESAEPPEYPGTVDQGIRRVMAHTAPEALAQFGRMFTAYAAGRAGRLYWRVRPSIERDNADRKYTVYARCLISDKPAIDGAA